MRAEGGIARIAVVVVSAGWLLLGALVLTHPIFVTNDSLNSYAHVWYVSQRLWGGHGLPYHMTPLAHGTALAFPYAFLPWLAAALLRPLLGDWAVTLVLVLGAAATIAGTWLALPELRGARTWTLVLLSPALIEGLILGQLAFLWGCALLFLAIACWRGGRILPAALLLGASQATHAPVMLPIAGVLFLGLLVRSPRQFRLRLVEAYAVSLVIAAPAIWMVLASPALGQASLGTSIANLVGTVLVRAPVVFWPLVLLGLMRLRLEPRWFTALIGVAIVLNLAVLPIREDQFGWRALLRQPDESLQAFTASSQFQPGSVYRLLRVGDGKVGMYDVVRAGGVLDSEFFPESIARRSWSTDADYADFLKQRRVGYVIIYGAYDRRYHTNEHDLLRSLQSQPAGDVEVSPLLSTPEYDVYRIAGREAR